ncbi:outer membrane autotransporter protein [Variovorax soli]|uniref:Outer membrane autotransporter protein n=2 Tax=Variovorax soli TaxID=376815 RepID=A0ABU1ND39_9BURK|nr:outer membrane autotransporter protein [Variovorax soli]
MPLFAALPAQLRQGDLAMLGNLHSRLGDSGTGPDRRAWVRAVHKDLDIRQSGNTLAHSDGHLSGLQAGSDLLVSGNWRFGLYVGGLDGSADVSGFANSTIGRVGSTDLRSRYLGGYASWRDADSGWYVDTVVQAGSHRYTVRPDASFTVSGKARSVSASVEAGKSFALAEGWSIEPQVQLIHQRNHLDDVTIAGARVHQDANGGWIGRVGLRIKGSIATELGRLQPYARINVYRASSGADLVDFVGPAVVTRIASASGYTATEVAGGLSLALTPAMTLYGEVGRTTSNGGEARVKSSVQGTMGVRVSW